MTVLVTGASGFVGSAVLRHLLDAGWEVRALLRQGSDSRNLDGLAVEIVTGDLTDRASLKSALAGCGALFHVAADYRLWTRHPARMFETNVEGTRALMETAAEAGVARIVHTSSVATLGINADGSPANEETTVAYEDMIGPYKQSKFRAEAEVRRMAAEGGLPVVIVNPSTPVGPRDVKPTPTGRMIVEAASGRMPAYVDTGLNIAHVDDVAAGHLLAFEHGTVGERYILGGEDMTLGAILGEIATITGGRAPLARIPHNLIVPLAYAVEAWTRIRGGDDPFVTVDGLRMARKKMFFSSEKARRHLGYAPRPAVEGLAAAIAWFGENGYLKNSPTRRSPDR
jgi:dihydroflavonol-4-reductase